MYFEGPIKTHVCRHLKKKTLSNSNIIKQQNKDNIGGTHIQNVLSQLLRFNAGEHSKQQVHDSRCADVFHHQVYKIHLLLQKIHNL